MPFSIGGPSSLLVIGTLNLCKEPVTMEKLRSVIKEAAGGQQSRATPILSIGQDPIADLQFEQNSPFAFAYMISIEAAEHVRERLNGRQILGCSLKVEFVPIPIEVPGKNSPDPWGRPTDGTWELQGLGSWEGGSTGSNEENQSEYHELAEAFGDQADDNWGVENGAWTIGFAGSVKEEERVEEEEEREWETKGGWGNVKGNAFPAEGNISGWGAQQREHQKDVFGGELAVGKYEGGGGGRGRFFGGADDRAALHWIGQDPRGGWDSFKGRNFEVSGGGLRGMAAGGESGRQGKGRLVLDLNGLTVSNFLTHIEFGVV